MAKYQLSSDKTRYRQLCAEEPSIPLFSQDWWLDSVVEHPDVWQVALVLSKDNVVAAMPYVLSTRKRLPAIVMPSFTKTLGPWLRENPQHKYATRLSYQHTLMEKLIEQLPAVYKFDQNFHGSIHNWLPFYWENYTQTTCYTYVVDALSDLEEVLGRFSSKRRNHLQKASQQLSVRMDLGLAEFYRLNQLSYTHQGLRAPYRFAQVEKADLALQAHQAREIFFAVDADGRTHAALYLIWDKQASYIHLIGHDKQFRNSHATVFLIWQAIQYTQTRLGLDRVDFEGSMLRPIEVLRRECAGVQVPYFNIRKRMPWWRFMVNFSHGKQKKPPTMIKK